MTDREWENSCDPRSMSIFLQGKWDERKYRLAECAMLRRFWDLLPKHSRSALEVAERLADRNVTPEEKTMGYAKAWAGFGFLKQEDPFPTASHYSGALAAANCVVTAFHDIPDLDTVPKTEHPGDAPESVWRLRAIVCAAQTRQANSNAQRLLAENIAQSAILRDIFSNPFRSIPLVRGYVTADILSLANAIYQTRSFGDLPVLADAIEESGCKDEFLLSHLREPSLHVLGCWALDLLAKMQ